MYCKFVKDKKELAEKLTNNQWIYKYQKIKENYKWVY